MFISDINEPAAQKAAEYITKQYPSSECQSIKCDVSSEADIKALVEGAVAKWGRLDVMVCRLFVTVSEVLMIVQQRWYHARTVCLTCQL